MEILNFIFNQFGETATQVFIYLVIIIAACSILVKIGLKFVGYTKTLKDDKIIAKLANLLKQLNPIYGHLLNFFAINPSKSDFEVLDAALKKLKAKKK